MVVASLLGTESLPICDAWRATKTPAASYFGDPAPCAPLLTKTLQIKEPWLNSRTDHRGLQNCLALSPNPPTAMRVLHRYRDQVR